MIMVMIINPCNKKIIFMLSGYFIMLSPFRKKQQIALVSPDFMSPLESWPSSEFHPGVYIAVDTDIQ